MTLKEPVKEYLDSIIEELESISNEDIRVVASLGVAQVLEDKVYELKYSKNIYKDIAYGNQ